MDTPAVQRQVRLLLCFAALLSGTACAFGQSSDRTVDLVLGSGRTLRVALDHRITVHRAGQTFTGTLIEPVYVYDRVVLPVGARLTGHFERVEEPSKTKRTLAMLSGDFSPHPQALLRFDSIADAEGHTIPLTTSVKGGTLRAKPRVAGGGKQDGDHQGKTGRVEQAKEAASAQIHDALALLEDPGRMARLEEMAIKQLPYHPEFLDKGMVYDVELLQPVDFGWVAPALQAPAGSLPAPDSVLKAKLATTIDSAKTPRGTPIEAVLSEPVFSAQHELILPEGTLLTGEVTQAAHARHWHRNGQLRVLFESVQAPAEPSHPLHASLYSVQAGAGEDVKVDEEGGTSIANSKTRFIPPALAVMAVRGSIHQEHELDNDDPGMPVHVVTNGNPGAQAIGGLFGFGAIGAVAGVMSRPVAIGFAVVGAARSVYKNIVAKGQEVTFAADTPIQVRLAPGPAAGK